jgi:26S proteasome regulatory subunit T1
MSPADISAFLDNAIRNRIGVRLIAEQHIALSRALRESPAEILHDGGIVDTQCSPAQMVRMCASFVKDLCEATLGSSPPIIIDGDVDTTFAYVPLYACHLSPSEVTTLPII